MARELSFTLKQSIFLPFATQYLYISSNAVLIKTQGSVEVNGNL